MTSEPSLLFRALAVASPAAIYITQDHRIRYANPAVESLTGYSSAELIGMDPIDLVHRDELVEASERRRARSEAPPGMGQGRFELKIRTRDGGTKWVDLTIAPFEFEGRPAEIGTAIDITDRKRLELRMVQGQRLEAVGRLAGGIAHDFNNLLMVMTGQTERLLEGLAEDHNLRDAAQAIAEAARRAASLTQQLLAFSQRQTLVPRPLDLSTAVREMKELLQDTLGDTVVVDADLSSSLPSVRADRARMEQVLMNLAVNARDAMSGQGRLTVTTDTVDVGESMLATRPWLRAGRFVRLQVHDTGVGMTQEVQQHLFEPFFTTKPPGVGAGLGLATVYGIVKQSGGFVWVDSEPGRGTRVTILLPPVEAAADEPPTAHPPVQARPVVLLVEDEAAVRELLLTVLERGGFDVRSAASAEEALAIDDRFDLLLTDVVLPQMTGPELARVIRERSPHTRVLFMSGYTGDAVLEDGDFDAGRAFIQKPFGSRTLVERLRELIEAPTPAQPERS